MDKFGLNSDYDFTAHLRRETEARIKAFYYTHAVSRHTFRLYHGGPTLLAVSMLLCMTLGARPRLLKNDGCIC